MLRLFDNDNDNDSDTKYIKFYKLFQPGFSAVSPS